MIFICRLLALRAVVALIFTPLTHTFVGNLCFPMRTVFELMFRVAAALPVCCFDIQGSSGDPR